MKSAILANAALCVCPPLIATAAVVTVPPARHAVHKLTAPHHRHHAAKRQDNRPPCAVKRATDAAGLPTDDDALAAIFPPSEGALRVVTLDLQSPVARHDSGILALGPRPTGPAAIRPVITQPAAIPEPSSWAMMIAGLLGVGTLCRKGARSRGRGAKLGRVVAAVEILSSPALGLGQTAVAAGTKATSAIAVAVAKKAGVCVCSGAILATAVTTVPPLKRAVYAATMSAPALARDICRTTS